MEKSKAFLGRYNSPNTRKLYTLVLKKYFNLFESGEELDEQNDKYFAHEKSDSEYKRDIKQFYASLRNSPTRTIQTFMSVIRTFFRRIVEKEFSTKFWEDYKPKSVESILEDVIPTKAELRQILNYMPIHGEAFFLMLVSSGMKIRE